MKRGLAKPAGDLYCCKCKQRGIPIQRKVSKGKESGHLKKMFCLNCNDTINHVEIYPDSVKYTYEDFILECTYGNFDEEYNRKEPFTQFKHKLYKNGVI